MDIDGYRNRLAASHNALDVSRHNMTCPWCRELNGLPLRRHGRRTARDTMGFVKPDQGRSGVSYPLPTYRARHRMEISV